MFEQIVLQNSGSLEDGKIPMPLITKGDPKKLNIKGVDVYVEQSESNYSTVDLSIFSIGSTPSNSFLIYCAIYTAAMLAAGLFIMKRKDF